MLILKKCFAVMKNITNFKWMGICSIHVQLVVGNVIRYAACLQYNYICFSMEEMVVYEPTVFLSV